ncbi:dipeptidase [Paenibacillus sp. FJAT-26967]|uniref:dipeptidase n=1 Tax=Paenibacillus sp. FJAT-26967 TaxID=1729690 RepID=UPI000837EF02|nr:dipeptidase [Paenibacillus sp. FJAT-26967]
MIIDAHCDALMKMYRNRRLDFQTPSVELDVNYPLMKAGGIKIQFLAIYLPEEIRTPGIEHVLEYVDILYQRILSNPEICLIRNRSDLNTVMNSSRKGVILSLEGVEGLQGNLGHLRILQRLGLRSVGLTWNFANWSADGIMEARGGGLTARGRMLIKESNHLNLMLDVSHLSIKGFWDLMEYPDLSVFASHSNAKSVCEHPRNLTDDQIKQLINQQGMIGLTFVPWFVHKADPVTISDLLRHLDHVCALGGEDYVGFGSDFDGIDRYITGLEDAGMYTNLANELCKRYSLSQVHKFLSRNWNRFLERNLPVS